ncbi:MAG: M20/M25/M40 family metallo-hydrolase, partial [Proteobacteria bacterium]|nr:M20/M25/M40 family metallo-hydrolase [Pseudomonadota bacterium]
MGLSMLSRVTAILGVLVALGAAPAAVAQEPDATVGLLQQLLRFDTSNPPGTTLQQATYLKQVFDAAGIENEIIRTPQEGVAHFIARLKGDGSSKPLLLAAHSDVVPVERQNWSVDPFAGEIRDGYVLGRGAMDFKGGQAVFAQAVLQLKKSGLALSRDVIFLAEADEEAGEYGTEWLAANHWDKIDAEFVLDEGGWIFQDQGGVTRQVNITTRDKIYAGLRLKVTGTATHSSRPQPDSAIGKLTRALAKLSTWDTDPTLTDQTRAYFRALSANATGAMRRDLETLASSRDAAALKAAGRRVSAHGEYPLLWHALMRNTVAATIVRAGVKENVIPGSAEAYLNLRLVPGSTPWDVKDQVEKLIADPDVKVSVDTRLSDADARAYYRKLAMAEASPTNTPLFSALQKAAKKTWPEATVLAALFEAGTDASAWRNRGIPT